MRKLPPSPPCGVTGMNRTTVRRIRKRKVRTLKRLLLEDGKIESLIYRHLLNESRDIFSESSRISLCLDDRRLKRYGHIEMRLILEIRSAFPSRENKGIHEGKLQCTGLRTRGAVTSVKRVKSNKGTRESESVPIVKSDICTVYFICHNLTSACHKRFSAGGKQPVDNRSSSREGLIP